MNDNDKPTLDELPGLLAMELATVGRALNGVSRDIICGILDDAVERAKAAEAKIAQLEAQIARQTFVTARRPPDETEVEVLTVAQWVPGIVPEARGRWRDRSYEFLNGVLGWRPRQE